MLVTGAGAAEARGVPGEWLVRFRPGVPAADVRRAAEAAGGRVEDEIPRWGIRLIRIPPGRDAAAAAESLRRHPGVELVEPNIRLHRAGLPSDPELSRQWGLDRIGATLAWGLTVAGAEGPDWGLIAVIDDGIDAGHPDLGAKLADGYDAETGATGVAAADPGPPPGTEHGTFVASVAAAATNGGGRMAGVAWRPRLLGVKLPAASGTTWVATEFSVLKGLAWAVERGAHVVNLSLGSCVPATTVMCGPAVCEEGTRIGADAMRAARLAGVTLVAAAGNECTTQPSYPAAYPFVLGVSATARDDAPAPYTNLGSWLDVAAPGGTMFVACDNLHGIVGATNDRTENCLGFSPFCSGPGDCTCGCLTAAAGTSMAAPHVAGAAAVLVGTLGASPARIAGELRRTADRIGGATGFTAAYGYGRINLYRALLGTGPPVEAALSLDIAVAPAGEDEVAVTVTVRNLGSAPATELVPFLSLAAGSPPASLVAAPAWSGTEVVTPGGSLVYRWTWRTSGAAPLRFDARVEGMDVATGGYVEAGGSGAGSPAPREFLVYPNPVLGDGVTVVVPVSGLAEEVTVEARNAATLALAWRGRWTGVSSVTAGLPVRGISSWAPGVYLVRAVERGGGRTRTHGPVRLLVKR